MSTLRAAGNSKKRGHQHHPRNEGTRKRFVLNSSADSADITYRNCDNKVVKRQGNQQVNEIPVINNSAFSDESFTSIKNHSHSTDKVLKKYDNEVIDLTVCNDESFSSINKQEVCDNSSNKNTSKNTHNQKKNVKTKKTKSKNVETKLDMSLVFRPEAEGSSLSDQELNEDNYFDSETEELSKLRCTSEMTEVVAEREKRRNRRCADYPGLAFASSIFSSDTLMKFSIIRNELHNIMNSQLKRVGNNIFLFKVTNCYTFTLT